MGMDGIADLQVGFVCASTYLEAMCVPAYFSRAPVQCLLVSLFITRTSDDLHYSSKQLCFLLI